MDSFEWNKIFMGLGFSALAVLGINELTKAIYDVEKPTEAAYVVEGVAVADAGGGAAAGGGELVLPDFGTVLPTADIAAGEKVAGKCAQCHTWDKGGPNKIGPNLWGVVGNHHAHLGDAFAYSAAMKELSGEEWDYEHLYRFLEAPGKVIKGTKMAFAGLKKSEDRVNLIAFLRTQSDSPLAIPAPNPAAAAPEGAAPAGEKPVAPGDGAPVEPTNPPPGTTEGASPEVNTGSPGEGAKTPSGTPPAASEGGTPPAPTESGNPPPPEGTPAPAEGTPAPSEGGAPAPAPAPAAGSPPPPPAEPAPPARVDANPTPEGGAAPGTEGAQPTTPSGH